MSLFEKLHQWFSKLMSAGKNPQTPSKKKTGASGDGGADTTSTEYLSQLQAVDREVSDPAKAAQQKAAMIGKWIGAGDDQLPFYAELQANAPIFQTPIFTIVTRYEDVMEAYNNDDVFTTAAFAGQINRDIGPFILAMKNSAEYERQKSILRLAVARTDADRIQALVTKESTQLLANLKPGDTFDLVAQYSRLLPALVVRQYLGVPEITTEQIWQWSRSMFRDIFANLTQDPTLTQAAVASRDVAFPILDQLIESRRQFLGQQGADHNPETVLDRLLTMQSTTTTALTNEEIRATILGTFVGMLDLTSIGIMVASIQLMKRGMWDKAQAAAQQDDAALMGYVMEALRFAPPAPGAFRMCEQDYVLAKGTARETALKAGSLVYVSSVAAMHDPIYVESPSEFRAGRDESAYLFWFSGLHTCLGQYFSQIQLTVALKGLLQLGHLQIVGAPTLEGGFPNNLPVKVV